jgi:UDP-2,3-diacylglucosamine pyrophosphatase LpxH
MLVVISDLHFVDSTSGNHNLPSKAFEQVFLSSIVGLAQKNKATELKLLLLGDIPDLIRSAQWFEEEMADRLWGENGLDDIPNPQPNSLTEKRCLDILGRFPDSKQREDVPKNTILYQNWDTFHFFRNFHKHLKKKAKEEYDIEDYDIPVEIIYIVGNHDRPINLYPSLRDELQKQLGLAVKPGTIDGDVDGEWWYKYEFRDDAYGVFARHGHQFDVYNYNGTDAYTRLDHLQVPIGDVIATEIAVNLVVTLESLRDEYPEITDGLVEAMQDVDNVRPLGRLMEWFYSKMEEQDDKRIREAMDKTIDIVIENFFDIDFVKNWNNPNTHVDELIRAASGRPFQAVLDFIVEHTDASKLIQLLLPTAEWYLKEGGIDDYMEGAYYEDVWREEDSPIRYILYGHTHNPLLKPLDSVDGRDVIYLNTGTWRERLHRTISLDTTANFVSLKQLTYMVFYNEDEDKKNKELGTIGFDSWTGNQQKQYAKDMKKGSSELQPKKG